jgi:pimeloyl-ACP methyl ester carboxylesterase
MSNEEIERGLRTGEAAGVLEDYFGPSDYAELRALSQQASAKRGAAGPRVLILPGILGSKLAVHEGDDDDVIWFDPIKIARGRITEIALASGQDIEPAGVILLFYLKLKLRLRAAGFDADFYAYDWRQSLDTLGAQLAQKIRGDKELNGVALVCHSMGGLVARAALKVLDGDNERVARIIQLGTPNFGSFDAVQTLRAQGDTLKKLAVLDFKHDANDIVTDVIAPMPGACQLLPSPEKFTAIDLFDAKSWPKTGPQLNAAVLRNVPAVLQTLAPGDDRFSLIAGVNEDTVTGVSLDPQTQEFVFEMSTAGDGTVPLALAELPGIKATYFVEETHGSLPNNRTVARACADILTTGTTSALPTSAAMVRGGTVRHVTEAELREHQPFDGRPASELSQRELREVLSDFLSTETSDGAAPVSIPAVASDAAAVGAPAQDFQRLVVGRRRQHRIDVRLALGDVSEVQTQALVVGIYSSVAPSGAARAIDERLEGAITELTQRRMFSGNVGEVFLLPTTQRAVHAEMVAFVGLGGFDVFTNDVLRIAAENAIRTLVLGGITDMATVLIGGGSGSAGASSLESLVTGFVKGLLDADKGDHFRCLTICEADPDRYDEIKSELLRLSATSLFGDLEITFFEEILPQPALIASVPGPRGPVARKPDPIYLLVRAESPPNQADTLVFRTSVLGAGSKATVVSGASNIKRSALTSKIAELQRNDFNLARSISYGQEIGELVLSDDARAILKTLTDRHVVVVHDAESSRVPWELLSVKNAGNTLVQLAKEAGMSRRYVADNMSVAKWLEERRQDKTFKLLLIVNPNRGDRNLDLAGAEDEGKRVHSILGSMPGVEIHELAGPDASRPALESAFRSGQYDAVHYAGHAFFDDRDVANSGILCANENVLSGRDLVGLGNLPMLVFFNACEAARVRGARPRGVPPKARFSKPAQERIDLNVSFAEAFLRGGVANYVGTYWPVDDDAAGAFAEQFYKTLIGGASIGDSLVTARRAVFSLKTSGAVDWADYVHYGSQDFVVKVT